MAQGDVEVFHDLTDDLWNAVHDVSGPDDFRLAYVSNAQAVNVADALPHFGGTGRTTDYSGSELTGGAVSAGGTVLTSEAFTGNGTGGFWTTAQVSVAVNGANPSTVRWGILYNNTPAGKPVIAYLDFGGITDLAGGLTININALGWFDMVVT